MAQVNTDISDLFFNTEHEDAGENEQTLRIEAGSFLESLSNLGIKVPSIDDLIADFYERV